MKTLYYVELNLVCIVILLLVRYQWGHKTEQRTTVKLVFNRIIWFTVLLCAADMAAGLSSGCRFPGARAVIEISNLLYDEIIVIIGYLWVRYVNCQLNGAERPAPVKYWLWTVPLLLFSALALTNHFTGILFSIDGDNCYVRGQGIWIHWLVSWFYLLAPGAKIARAARREKSRHRRKETSLLLYFIIAPVLAGVAQMLVYGLSATQVGFTVSVVISVLIVQGDQVMTDTLTGLNNRRGLDSYLDRHLQRHPGAALSVLMIDLNDFKLVNDRYGHLMGDRALQELAELLKRVCRSLPGRPFLCRFGGDEFVIVGDSAVSAPETIAEAVRRELAAQPPQGDRAPLLEASIGIAAGCCAAPEDAESLLRAADRAMYEDKQRHDGMKTGACGPESAPARILPKRGE